MVSVQVDGDAAVLPRELDESRDLLKLTAQGVRVGVGVLHAELQAVGCDLVRARIRHAGFRLEAEREAHARRDEIAVEAFHAAVQEREHDARARVLPADAHERVLARVDGRREDLRDGDVRAHGVIGPLGHGLGDGDDGPLRAVRQHALRVEDAVLERLAELGARRVIFAEEALADAAEELREHDPRRAARTEDRRRRHTPREPADAVVLRIRERLHGGPHRAQDMGAGQRAAALECVDAFVFEQELTVRAHDHALEIAARDDFLIA